MFELVQNDALDQETLTRVHNEFRARNVSTLELKELQQQHETTFKVVKQELASTTFWDPLYTAFAWRKHFHHIALLRTHGSKTQAKQHKLRFYLGILIYMLIIILIILLISK